jgi:hypothetical protein
VSDLINVVDRKIEAAIGERERERERERAPIDAFERDFYLCRI